MNRQLTYCLIIALLIAIVGGCSRPPQIAGEVGWPPPPASPRVVYERSIYGTQDLRRSFFGKISDFLFGKGPAHGIGKPYGVTVDDHGRLLVAETEKKSVLVLDLKAGRSKTINSLGNHGRLGEPVYVILDKARNVYVADTKLKKVVVFDPDYRFSHFIGGEDLLESPVGMAFDKDEKKLYVVDTKLHLIRVFDKSGRLLQTIGRRGDNQGEFYHPLTVAVGDGDTLFVVDAFHFTVQVLDSAGGFVSSIGRSGGGVGDLARPRDIAMDSEGHLYVTDAVRNDIKVYDQSGNLLLRIGGGGVGPGQFRLPAGITIDDDDRIYISDSINGRIQVLRFLSETG